MPETPFSQFFPRILFTHPSKFSLYGTCLWSSHSAFSSAGFLSLNPHFQATMLLLISFIPSFVPVLVHQTFVVLFLLQSPVLALFFSFVWSNKWQGTTRVKALFRLRVKEVSLLPSVIKHWQRQLMEERVNFRLFTSRSRFPLLKFQASSDNLGCSHSFLSPLCFPFFPLEGRPKPHFLTLELRLINRTIVSRGSRSALGPDSWFQKRTLHLLMGICEHLEYFEAIVAKLGLKGGLYLLAAGTGLHQP